MYIYIYMRQRSCLSAGRDTSPSGGFVGRFCWGSAWWAGLRPAPLPWLAALSFVAAPWNGAGLPCHSGGAGSAHPVASGGCPFLPLRCALRSLGGLWHSLHWGGCFCRAAFGGGALGCGPHSVGDCRRQWHSTAGRRSARSFLPCLAALLWGSRRRRTPRCHWCRRSAGRLCSADAAVHLTLAAMSTRARGPPHSSLSLAIAPSLILRRRGRVRRRRV